MDNLVRKIELPLAKRAVEKAGMLAIQELYALQYSNNREDYSDDASFTNFRSVTGAESVEQLEQIDLESAVTVYLTESGMSQEDIVMLKEKLG